MPSLEQSSKNNSNIIIPLSGNRNYNHRYYSQPLFQCTYINIFTKYNFIIYIDQYLYYLSTYRYGHEDAYDGCGCGEPFHNTFKGHLVLKPNTVTMYVHIDIVGN